MGGGTGAQVIDSGATGDETAAAVITQQAERSCGRDLAGILQTILQTANRSDPDLKQYLQ
jgi:hypothetical protein